MGTLEDLICGGNEDFAMTDSSHLPVLHQITSGLNQLHSLGIVHGNLKPSNILVSFPKGDTNEPMMKLADFGIRHAVRDEATGLTQFRPVTTEGWMCPTDPQDPNSPSFDVFSLACVFVFSTCKGIHPFGTDPISRIANKKPMKLTLSKMNASVQCHSFIDLIVQMLHFDETKRPSIDDILNRLTFNEKATAAVTHRDNREIPELMPISSLSHVDQHQMPELVPCFPSSTVSIPVTPQHQLNRTAIPSVVTTDVDSTSDGQEKILTRPAATDQSHVVSSSFSDVRSPSPSAPIPHPLVPSSSSESDDAQPPKPNSCYVSSTRGRRLQQRPPSSSSSFDNSSTDGDSKRQFSCDICSYSVDSCSKFTYHMKTHANVERYECNYCSKIFISSKNLKSHRKGHLPPEFKCDFCPKMFTYKYGRDQHMNVHTGAKPYDCDLCHEKFTDPVTRGHHRRTKHFPPQFECPFCHKKFSFYKNCQRHWYGEKNRQYGIACRVRRQLIAD